MGTSRSSKCIVKGCINRKTEGSFVGDLCGPCYLLLTTGKLGYGVDFISSALRKLAYIKKTVDDPTF